MPSPPSFFLDEEVNETVLDEFLEARSKDFKDRIAVAELRVSAQMVKLVAMQVKEATSILDMSVTPLSGHRKMKNTSFSFQVWLSKLIDQLKRKLKFAAFQYPSSSKLDDSLIVKDTVSLNHQSFQIKSKVLPL